jgi:hypothetical protein
MSFTQPVTALLISKLAPVGAEVGPELGVEPHVAEHEHIPIAPMNILTSVAGKVKSPASICRDQVVTAGCQEDPLVVQAAI